MTIKNTLASGMNLVMSLVQKFTGTVTEVERTDSLIYTESYKEVEEFTMAANNRSLNDEIVAGHYSHMDGGINEERYFSSSSGKPNNDEGREEKVFRIYRFNIKVQCYDVVSEMSKDGYRFAGLQHLFDFCKVNLGHQRPLTIVCDDFLIKQYILACLVKDDLKCRMILEPHTMRCGTKCQFLGVKNQPSGSMVF
ncbi:MAG: hypothetical protein AAB957_00760 [Patescibacteria group bacterium]|mgnify:CR=1 FL=1